MYEINNINFRNLEEQVQKNKEDIARHYEIDRVLANLGIKLIGQVTLESQLPDPLTYTGTYGDAYAVGNRNAVDQGIASYTYYVYSRPDPNSGQPENHWLNVGKISIIGPQGPVGPEGPQGPIGESSQWYALSDPSNPKMNDMRLEQNGDVYQYLDAENFQGWIYITNIKGPQGIQGPRGPIGPQGPEGPIGPQGERGDVGGFINIRGILTNTNELPLPSQLENLTIAYLIGASEPYDLYVQIGEDSTTATWNNTGPFNAATLVTVGGEAQNIWDADTKLDKKTKNVNFVYGYFAGSGGLQTTYNLGSNYATVNNGTIAQHFGEAQASVGERAPNAGTGFLYCATPISPYFTANKKYVDDGLATKISVPEGSPKGYQTVVGYPSNSTTPKLYGVTATASSGAAGSIVKYNENGALMSVEPTQNTEVATKGYVDSVVTSGGTKLFLHKFTSNLPVEAGGAIMSGWFYSTKNTQILNTQFIISNVDDIQSIVGDIRYFHNNEAWPVTWTPAAIALDTPNDVENLVEQIIPV